MGLSRVRPTQREVLGALPGLRPESEATMIRAVFVAARDGYRWPEDWNRYQHILGHHFAVIDPPPRYRRVLRAAVWATNTFREQLAVRIHPDT